MLWLSVLSTHKYTHTGFFLWMSTSILHTRCMSHIQQWCNYKICKSFTKLFTRAAEALEMPENEIHANSQKKKKKNNSGRNLIFSRAQGLMGSQNRAIAVFLSNHQSKTERKNPFSLQFRDSASRFPVTATAYSVESIKTLDMVHHAEDKSIRATFPDRATILFYFVWHDGYFCLHLGDSLLE